MPRSTSRRPSVLLASVSDPFVPEDEFHVVACVLDRVIGPLLLWSARREGEAYPQGRPREPRMFVDRRDGR